VISPLLLASGWDETRWRCEYAITAGRIIFRGELIARGKQKRADYLLIYKSNMTIAIIEAKDNTQSIGVGIQQGLAYSAAIDVPFVFSSNGDGFLFHDKTGNAKQNQVIHSLVDSPSYLLIAITLRSKSIS
jgi:type I restriction enzyme R subunit